MRELNALSDRRTRDERAKNFRSVLLAVTMRRLQGENVGLEDYLPELEQDVSEAKMLRALAYFEGLAAQTPKV